MNIDSILTNSPLLNDIAPMNGPQAVSPSASQGAEIEQLKTAAKGFEAIFVKQILKQMQETIQNASFDPDDSSNEQVHGMYCTFLADSIAQDGGFGLWENIYEQMADAAGLSSEAQAAVQLDQKA